MATVTELFIHASNGYRVYPRCMVVGWKKRLQEKEGDQPVWLLRVQFKKSCTYIIMVKELKIK